MRRAPAEPVVGRPPAGCPVEGRPAQQFSVPVQREALACDGAGAEGARLETPRARPTHRADRVRRHSEYRLIQSRGRRVHSAHYVWIVMPRLPAPAGEARRIRDGAPPGAHPTGARLGITMTRKAMPRAVARNRARRVLREVFRLDAALFPAGCDVVVVGRAGAEELGYADALAEVRGIAPKLAAAARSGTPRSGERRG